MVSGPAVGSTSVSAAATIEEVRVCAIGPLTTSARPDPDTVSTIVTTRTAVFRRNGPKCPLGLRSVTKHPLCFSIGPVPNALPPNFLGNTIGFPAAGCGPSIEWPSAPWLYRGRRFAVATKVNSRRRLELLQPERQTGRASASLSGAADPRSPRRQLIRPLTQPFPSAVLVRCACHSICDKSPNRGTILTASLLRDG
jgi:hypothetical protein